VCKNKTKLNLVNALQTCSSKLLSLYLLPTDYTEIQIYLLFCTVIKHGLPLIGRTWDEGIKHGGRQGQNGAEERRERKKIHNEELFDLYISADISRVTE
jgi:hypothetical protein